MKMNYSYIQNIKTKINNCNMNIFHKITRLKNVKLQRQKITFVLVLIYLSPNVVYQGKIASSQPNYRELWGKYFREEFNPSKAGFFESKFFCGVSLTAPG